MKTAATKAKKAKFPIRIRRGSVTVTIYRVANSGTTSGHLYQVSWNAGGHRRRKGFADFSKANDEAILQAELLAAGKVSTAQDASIEEMDALAEARRLCGSIPILAALEEWKKAREVCGDELLAAARLWRDTHAADVERVTTQEAVSRFLDSKIKAGVNTKATYGYVLNRLVDSFGPMPIADLTARILTEWLEAIEHPVSRNTYRKRIVAVWRWCRKQGLLPRVATTEAEMTERAREDQSEIGILTVPAWRRALELIRSNYPENLATLVLAGFAGLRRAELHAQRWSDIHLERGFLRVTKAKRNTPSKRLVQLCPAAVQWLMLCDKTEKQIAPPWSIDRIRKVCREADPVIECPENGFRHSFISYRVAKSGNVAETALEAGNSPAIVHRHYRELVVKADGAAWFESYPDTPQSNIAKITA